MTADFETVYFTDSGTVSGDVMVIEIPKPAQVFLSLHGDDVEIIADLTPQRALEVANALINAAAVAAQINVGRGQ